MDVVLTLFKALFELSSSDCQLCTQTTIYFFSFSAACVPEWKQESSEMRPSKHLPAFRGIKGGVPLTVSADMLDERLSTQGDGYSSCIFSAEMGFWQKNWLEPCSRAPTVHSGPTCTRSGHEVHSQAAHVRRHGCWLRPYLKYMESIPTLT